MTNQEIYDKVKAHLLKQGRRASTAEGRCRYRAMDGTKCAIGCLIPDGEYRLNMEGNGVGVLSDEYGEQLVNSLGRFPIDVELVGSSAPCR